jgi:6,7-dimethyl-8-ribityllumazine synthase
MRFAIVVSRFNAEVTEGLLAGATRYLAEQGIPKDSVELVRAPGAFEMPLLAQRIARRSQSAANRVDGVICLGAVIKGDTAHFEFISLGASVGVMQAMLATDVPIAFGILTTYNDEQAESRSRDDAHNKGREAAAACFETAVTLSRLG